MSRQSVKQSLANLMAIKLLFPHLLTPEQRADLDALRRGERPLTPLRRAPEPYSAHWEQKRRVTKAEIGALARKIYGAHGASAANHD